MDEQNADQQDEERDTLDKNDEIDQQGGGKPQGRSFRENAVLLLSRSRTLTVATLILSGVLIPLAIGAAILAVFYAVPAVWNFFAITPTLTWHWLKVVPAFFAETFLIGGIVYVPVGAVLGFGYILNVYAEIAAGPVTKEVSKLREQQNNAETVLEQSDTEGLIPLVRYSRAQLEAYYTIGLNQTQRSFRYSVIAMWLGFAVLLAGLTYQTLPLNLILQTVGEPPPGNVAVIALAGSTVIELIAALGTAETTSQARATLDRIVRKSP